MAILKHMNFAENVVAVAKRMKDKYCADCSETFEETMPDGRKKRYLCDSRIFKDKCPIAELRKLISVFKRFDGF